MIGTVLDKYEVVQKVGEGGMATVYKGRHTTLGRDVAIKILHPHLSASTRNRKRFAREARAIEHLKHPNILEIQDYSGTDTDDCYIVTEFVLGDTLTETLNRLGKVPSEIAAMIGEDLAHALDFAHKNNVLHRDLKPDNVMIRQDGTVKLMDFGIARFLDESQVTMTGALVGSPAFMSPEQAADKELDARSDLFSLGTLLFFLVTGHLPFAGNNPSVILKNIIDGNRPAVSELVPTMSASLADVIERLLASDKNDRFNSASEVALALRACLSEVGVDRNAHGFTLLEYLVDPEPWVRRMDEHLKKALLEGGKAARDRGDQLAALRLWNRLLSIDEANEEVLTLVSGLHAESPDAHRPRSRVALALGGFAAFVLAGVVAVGVIYGQRPATPVVEPHEPPVDLTVSAATLGAPPGDDPVDVVPADDPPETPVDPGEATPAKASSAKVPGVLKPVRTVPELRSPALGGPATVPLATANGAGTPGGTADDALVKVTFKVANSEVYANVWCDGTKVAGTRGANHAMLAPGIWTCVYKAQQIYDEEFQFVVDAGKPHEEVHAVRLRPLPVRFDATCDDACKVRVDDVSVGTVGSLGRTYDIVDRPDQKHRVEVSCGDKARVYDFDGTSRPVSCGP